MCRLMLYNNLGSIINVLVCEFSSVCNHFNSELWSSVKPHHILISMQMHTIHFNPFQISFKNKIFQGTFLSSMTSDLH